MSPSLPEPSKPPPCDDQQSWCPPPPIVPYYPPPPPPPPPASHGRGTFVTALIIAGSVLAFLAICLSIFILVRRRRQRQREALLEAALAPAAPAVLPDEGGGPAGGEVVHHAWHIRTVGLDEAAIESIALTRFRAGAALGASDCTVCLGEFRDGELLRLLPKCAHAFHVQCIDTWLRAHVSCPLCRAHVMDPAAEQPDTTPGADADASAQQFASGNPIMVEHEQTHQDANDQQDRRVENHIDRPDHSSSPERSHRNPGEWAQNFRRVGVASMDSPLPTASAREAPEQDQADGEKQGTGGAVCREVSPESSYFNRPAMKRSLSAGSRWRRTSRHCRARSSLLPL